MRGAVHGPTREAIGAARRAARPRVRAIPFWVAALSLAGCLADPPTFAPRGQIPPFIIAGQVDPPLGSIYEGSPVFEINAPFRSEDVNEPLEARLYLDLPPGASQATGFAFLRVPPSNYEELRLISIPVDVRFATGPCHSLTLIVTYENNLDQRRGGLPRDETRAARAVWWLNMNEPDALLSDCPSASAIDGVLSGG